MIWPKGLKVSVLNMTTFCALQIVHSRKLKFCNSFDIHILFIFPKDRVQSWLKFHRIWCGIHWCWTASFQTLVVPRHPQNRWLIDSTSSSQSGHRGSILQPHLKSVPLTGSALWRSYHRKTLILGMASIFHIHLYCHGCCSDILFPYASQVADLVVKIPNCLVSNKRNHLFLYQSMQSLQFFELFDDLGESNLISVFPTVHCG